MSAQILFSPEAIAIKLKIVDSKVNDPSAYQSKIISAPLAPAVVIAGAGSGKTETMSARVLYLIANGLARPEEILGLTFTRKAAGELGVRIRSKLRQLRDPRLGLDIPRGDPVIMTYHSYAGRLLTSTRFAMELTPVLIQSVKPQFGRWPPGLWATGPTMISPLKVH